MWKPFMNEPFAFKHEGIPAFLLLFGEAAVEAFIIYSIKKIKTFFHYLKLKWGGIEAQQREVWNAWVGLECWSYLCADTVLFNKGIVSLAAEMSTHCSHKINLNNQSNNYL